MRRSLLVLAVLVPLLAAPALAQEKEGGSSGSSGSLDPNFRGPGSLQDASPQRRSHMLSFFFNFPAAYWGYGGVPFGIGGRYFLPILHDGFVPPINDSFGLEFGADMIAIGGRNYFGVGLGIPIEAKWGLHLSRRFELYLKLGLAIEYHFGNWYWGGSSITALGWGGIAGIGLIYQITDAIALRAELGYPGLKLGIGFPL